jgi:flagellar biosynthesis protein FlhF
MQLEKILAPTMAEALQQVKRMLGPDAVILSTRTIQTRRWLGLRKRVTVEVMAGKGMNVVPRRKPPNGAQTPVIKQVPTAPPHAINEYNAHKPKTGIHSLQPNGHANGQTKPPAPDNGRSFMQTPEVQSVAMVGFSNEINSLKSMVKDLVHEVRHRTAPQVPEELFEEYQKLMIAEVSEELATDIIRKVHQHARPEQLLNEQFVKDRILEQLEKLIPLSGPIERSKATGPHVVALIGPTGVGKTTTIAKLAANLKLRQKRKVGLITIDTYRIAAIDQLRRYADLIGVQLAVVTSPEEIIDAVAAFADCEYVLIDTAGRSPTDALKLNELGRYLENAKVDEVHLVLSSTCGVKSAELVMERFGAVRVDKVIITKVDEAAQLGVVLSVVRKLNKGLSYMTNGQDVPDDIEEGHARRIARLILGER